MRVSRVALLISLEAILALAMIGGSIGCSKELRNRGTNALMSPTNNALSARHSPDAGAGVVNQDGTTAPAGLVSVSFGSESLELWPYTGVSFDGEPADPVNVLFVGKADPVKIRAALLSLDGNRSAYGFPDAYPFNATWSDANGGVQTNYAEGEGWQGNAIQLQLGNYQPVRAHLRLFRTSKSFGTGGLWTVGAVHFEVMIPGTADHQVLSWELPQQILLVDMLRSGLLEPSAPFQLTAAITQTPGFRTIPPAIYNGLPAALKAVIGGPPGPVAAPVPIGNDGKATIFNLAGEVPVRAGEFTSTFTLNYNQIIPKPLCSEGPLDYVRVLGPVTLSHTATVDESGRYQYHQRIFGRLEVTPIDVTHSPPVPSGDSFPANASELQDGAIDGNGTWVMAESKRITQENGGAELLMTRLRVGTRGEKSFHSLSRCLSPGP